MTCTCGSAATLKLFAHYRYPRTEWMPEAMDPHYVHGGGYSIEVCGNPQCEADAFLACREQIISNSRRPGLTDGQIAGLELQVALRPEDMMRVLGGDND